MELAGEDKPMVVETKVNGLLVESREIKEEKHFQVDEIVIE